MFYVQNTTRPRFAHLFFDSQESLLQVVRDAMGLIISFQNLMDTLHRLSTAEALKLDRQKDVQRVSAQLSARWWPSAEYIASSRATPPRHQSLRIQKRPRRTCSDLKGRSRNAQRDSAQRWSSWSLGWKHIPITKSSFWPCDSPSTNTIR